MSTTEKAHLNTYPDAHLNTHRTMWQKVSASSKKEGRPFFVLAPMADVTDAAFRRIITKYGKPDVIWTEFVSADGLCSPGREVLLRDLAFTEAERPIIAQLFSAHPEKMYEAAKLVAKLGFDGLDINMGCPDRSIEKQGAGAAMIKTPELAQEVIRAAQRGVADAAKEMVEMAEVAETAAASNVTSAAANTPGASTPSSQLIPIPFPIPIPISVKTRIGYNKVEIETWVPALLSTGIAALTIHARTRKEMSDVPAQWQYVKRVVEIRDALQAHLAPEDRTLILGNGDALDLKDAEAKATATGADGVMLGRAIFGNPWLFSGLHSGKMAHHKPTIKERLDVLVEHTYLYEKLLGGVKNFAVMKKHYKAYVAGWDGAKEFRTHLMELSSADEVAKAVEEYMLNMK